MTNMGSIIRNRIDYNGRVVTRYVGSGIKGVGSRIREGWDLDYSPGIREHRHGIGISSFFRDQGSGFTIFMGSRTKIGHGFGIKDQEFAFKIGISNEKTYLVTTLIMG